MVVRPRTFLSLPPETFIFSINFPVIKRLIPQFFVALVFLRNAEKLKLSFMNNFDFRISKRLPQTLP